jgi:hypothetical protein
VIQTYDLRFIRRGSQPIELPLGDNLKSHFSAKSTLITSDIL